MGEAPGDSRRSAEGTRAVSAARLRWLEGELVDWENEGLITRSAAQRIHRRYTKDSKAKLLAIITGLGVTFVAIGLIWLVAANLDELHPMVRLGAVAAVWLGLAIAGEAFRSQRLAEVCRTLAAVAFGAVIFQAAQSLQVPAYEPVLLGCWGLGALVYAYATGGWGAFGVGLIASTAWFAWQAGESVRSAPEAALVAMCGAIVATSVALAHRGGLDRVRPGYATGWRIISAAMALAGLFIAAIPVGPSSESPWRPFLWWTAGVAAVAAIIGIAVAARARVPQRPAHLDGEPGDAAGGPVRAVSEVLVLVGLTALAAGLALWQPETDLGFGGYDPTSMSPEVWTRTGVSIVVYLVAVAWFAVLGSWREAPGLTTIAMAALVLFTTFQSFAVFAPIISGATLFLAVGAVMLVTGLAAERIRRVLRRRSRKRRPRGSRPEAPPAVSEPGPETGSEPVSEPKPERQPKPESEPKPERKPKPESEEERP